MAEKVAVAMAMQQLLGTKLGGLAIAQLCQQAEHEYAGVPCGLMDQLSSVFGRTNELMLMDCRTNQLEFIPASHELAFIVVNSRVKHNLADGEYRQRRQQCEEACRLLGVASLRDVDAARLESTRSKMSDLVYRRARHVVSENARTVQAADCLKSNEGKDTEDDALFGGMLQPFYGSQLLSWWGDVHLFTSRFPTSSRPCRAYRASSGSDDRCERNSR